MTAAYLSKVGNDLVKRCGTRDPFRIARELGIGLSGTVGVVALNIVLGGLIGGVILIWKLAVAVWYLPLTVYRLFA